MDRRQFLERAGTGLVGAALVGSAMDTVFGYPASPQVVRVENGEPEALLAAALKEYGGMQHFISRGDVVVVKPNMGWDRAPEYAANTNPALVAAIVRACLDAGAKTVKVFDRTCNNPLRCYTNSGIETSAQEAGADVSQVRESRFVGKSVGGEVVREWQIYRDYLEADKTINVPIAKHHSLSRVTLGLKNLMGVMGGNRGDLHNDFARKLVDITRTILPTLTIIDAYRILTANGPVGGNLAHVRQPRTLIMSPCVVSADHEALDLFGLKPADAGLVDLAAKRGLARFDIPSLQVKKVRLA